MIKNCTFLTFLYFFLEFLSKRFYIIVNMTTTNYEMTTIRVPKKVVEMIDKARSGGLPKLSQTQMATKAIIDGLRFVTTDGVGCRLTLNKEKI